MQAWTLPDQPAGSDGAPNLLFIDADVHLAPEAAARLAGALELKDLVSGVPRQRMVSLTEVLIIPMINMLLLGYLPILLTRRSRQCAAPEEGACAIHFASVGEIAKGGPAA